MILLDTHTALWMTYARKRLSETAASTLRRSAESDEGLAIAGSSLWEVAMLTSKGRLQLPTSLPLFLHLEQLFVVLPMTAAIAERSILFTKAFPYDPTNRIIAATAVVHGLKLVTRDRAMRASNEVQCIW